MEKDKRGSKKRSKGRKSSKKSKDIDAVKVKSDPTHSRKSRKSRNERHKKIKSSSALPDYQHHHDHDQEDEVPKQRTLTRSDLVHVICEFFADDFWETAWDICETRFVQKNASVFIMSDLRDSWLSIIGMQWMDTDPIVPHGIRLLDFQIEDRPPLPPKFDSWSHGALEFIPRTCRESIMDPFLRDPLPWLLGDLQRNPWELPAVTKSSDDSFYDESGLTTGMKMSANASQAAHVARPTSPVPSEEEEASDSHETESTWSLATTTGSLSRLYDPKFVDSGERLESFSTSSGSLRPVTIAKESVTTKASSIEFLYPSKLPVPEFRASSEFTYNLGGSSSSAISKTGSGFVAFKLPHQTSSESKIVHEQRKKFLQEKKASSSTTTAASSSKTKYKK